MSTEASLLSALDTADPPECRVRGSTLPWLLPRPLLSPCSSSGYWDLGNRRSIASSPAQSTSYLAPSIDHTQRPASLARARAAVIAPCNGGRR